MTVHLHHGTCQPGGFFLRQPILVLISDQLVGKALLVGDALVLKSTCRWM